MLIHDTSKRLAIVIPYRDRQECLARFSPHILTYFQRDKVDRHISVEFFLIEQTPGCLFNKGILLNTGFAFTKGQFDYYCFHDVDYLPQWVDYSYPTNPTRLIWYGSEIRPIKIGGEGYIRHSYEMGFGGVVLFRKEHFELVNGYSNDYWGWGFEDSDIANRCQLERLVLDKKDGTFVAIDHDNEGYNQDGTPNEQFRKTEEIYEKKKALYRLSKTYKEDGLSNLASEIQGVSQNKIMKQKKTLGIFNTIRVDVTKMYES